ncbi:2-Hydroxyacid oxidase 1-like isoform X1 [Diabrotica virgifera virgifera]|uniref:FMN hydroxy acid dehydrogenase domain-containing protein n=1 Tax=Diabrotica virgifera virgifera TaxID=50390 RepID=A0ABM5JJ88_DIAVI|nr:2-Hydroxyacid oxidase 1-like isoform X1 [Diabrotica virgifera virgifera]
MSLVCIDDYEKYAQEKLPKIIYEFFQSGAGRELSLKWNRTSFSRYRIRPRYMKKVDVRNLSTNVLGKPVSIPIGISPVAFHKLAHSDGECGSVKAAEDNQTIFILSSHSNSYIDEVARAAPNARKWLQLYIFQKRSITQDLIQEAESNGFEAIVLTVDFVAFGLRLVNIRNKFKLPPNLCSALLKKYQNNNVLNSLVDISDPTADWNYIKWLKTITNLPIVVKGILTAEDAVLAVEAGVSAILVSNHGARQLDTVPASIEVLPEIVQAVGSRVDVYMDGGIRDGTDIFKALALGAKMVFVGRPIIWGLNHDGEKGGKKILGILKRELDNVMALTGCTSISEINKDVVIHESFYSKI